MTDSRHYQRVHALHSGSSRDAADTRAPSNQGRRGSSWQGIPRRDGQSRASQPKGNDESVAIQLLRRAVQLAAQALGHRRTEADAAPARTASTSVAASMMPSDGEDTGDGLEDRLPGASVSRVSQRRVQLCAHNIPEPRRAVTSVAHRVELLIGTIACRVLNAVCLRMHVHPSP